MQTFIEFVKESPVSFFTVKNLKAMFDEAGFESLPPEGSWNVEAGHSYYTTVYDSAIFAFRLPHDLSKVKAPFFRMIGAHTDSPCLRIKPEGQMLSDGFVKLNAEVYGGPIFSTWMDRPLSLAGRVTLKSRDPFHPDVRLVDLKEPVLVIPNLAIHMNRNVNSGVEINPQTDLLPVGALADQLDNRKASVVLEALSKACGVREEEIADFDMFAYNTDQPEVAGFHHEFLSAPRLDDLCMVYTGAAALVESQPSTSINVFCGFDHEEIGSHTPQGAGTATLSIMLEKMSEALGRSRGQFLDDIRGSFMISGDVAHSVHPNHPEKNDPALKPCLGKGPVIKMSARQSYMTQSLDTAVYESLCQKAGVPVQKFVNRSDQRGGSTIGPILGAFVPCHIMDMGIALLAMHSARELMAVADLDYTKRSFISYYQA